MKKAFVVIAVLIAVVASTSLGGVKTASAFNPQPDPPESMPGNVKTFYVQTISKIVTFRLDDRTDVTVNGIGAAARGLAPRASGP